MNPEIASVSSNTGAISTTQWAKTHARVSPVPLLSADILGFVIATFMAAAINAAPSLPPDTRVASLHGWGTMLALVLLLGFFAGRGHYTMRVSAWTQLGDVVIATAVALGCDVFLTVAVSRGTMELEGLLRWLLVCPCMLLLRAATCQALQFAGRWTLISTPSKNIASEGATSEPPQQIGLPIALVPSSNGVSVTSLRRSTFHRHGIVIRNGSNNLRQSLSRLIKAVFDQFLALILLFLFAPLLLGLAILVRADGGPALSRHRRFGAGGRPFECIKFRSMAVDAERVLREVLEADPAAAVEWGATQKLRDEPRITGIGRFLRESGLDELPQLLNVLRGEMGLVGPSLSVAPAPIRYGTDTEHYNAAKPGITGLWQVSGCGDMSYTSRVQLDVWYVHNWTLWHDIAILLKTIPAVFLRRGAH